LAGIRILDLSRILAGPTCTQILGDLGAEVIKVEKPGLGDDTRTWGPPYVTGPDGKPSTESAYYLAANRNKRSISLDFSKPEGLAIARRLISQSDVLVENYKTGTLARHGLGYVDLHAEFPRLVYASITGFGQTGPYATLSGYDVLAQAMGGIMSLTGDPNGPPMKVGVGIADITTGLYTTIGILAALRHRDATGEGQQIDVSLLDTQVSWLINEAMNYFVSGDRPIRRGNEHPNIAPYKMYATADGFLVLAVGNDAQFRTWCDLTEMRSLVDDERFATNSARVVHRGQLDAFIEPVMKSRTRAEWLALLGPAGVPCGPVNSVDEVFADEQVRTRGMQIEMPYSHAASGSVSLVGNPLHLSATPVSYRIPPPIAGEHTVEVLRDLAGIDAEIFRTLKKSGVV
jgi:crotonobetainyl-CoA:carnitine CoA-transferase CaiB-like acyl-CoA transferase